MPLILLTKPEEEPLSVDDMKVYLRVDHDDDDALIFDLIAAARRHVENGTGKRLVTQAWRVVLDVWPDDGVVSLPLSPVVRVAGACLRAINGVATPLATADWILDCSGRLHIAFRPPLLRAFAGIEIDVEVGFGAGSEVPAGFVQAIRLLVAHWYENRTVASGETLFQPLAVAALMAPERALRL
jgi:uncharacterized phiE125 gp8 family phage protein